jgi:hypothetical protein
MASMSIEIVVLRALLSLSRRRAPATFAELLDRVTRELRDATERDVQRALGSFARAGLVMRNGEQARLSLAGLAVAVAAVRHAHEQARSRAKTVAAPRTARVTPVVPIRRAVRRHHAA